MYADHRTHCNGRDIIIEEELKQNEKQDLNREQYQ